MPLVLIKGSSQEENNSASVLDLIHIADVQLQINKNTTFYLPLEVFIPRVLVGSSIKLQKEIIETENNVVKNPNWQEADQLAIYKHSRGVELGATDQGLRITTT